MGSALLLSVLTVMVCAALLVNSHRTLEVKSDNVSPRSGGTGRIGDMSKMEIEAAYGPVNHSASNETKQGLLFRRRCSNYSRQATFSNYSYYSSAACNSAPVTRATYRSCAQTFQPVAAQPLPVEPWQSSCNTNSCSPATQVVAPVAQPVIQPPAAPAVARPEPSTYPLRIVPSV